MNMTPRFQKIALLAHIVFSVGWFGSVLPYLALAIAALTSRNEQMVRAACLSMNLIGWFVIVPFSFGALLSGLVQSFGTRWGLFRYWWVLAKFALTIFAVVVLFQHMRDVSRVTLMAKELAVSTANLRPELIHSAGGLLVLLAAMILSVFKPWGTTPYGRRQVSQPKVRPQPRATFVHEPILVVSKPRWGRIIGFHAAGIVVVLAVVHLAMFHLSGLHHH